MERNSSPDPQFVALCEDAERLDFVVGLGVGELGGPDNCRYRQMTAISTWPKKGKPRDGLTQAIRFGETPGIAALHLRVELERKFGVK